MESEDAQEHDREVNHTNGRWSVRCVIDRALYASMYNDLSDRRSATNDSYKISLIQLAYVRLWWKDISTIMLLGAKRGSFVNGAKDLNVNGNVMEYIMKAWFQMCYEEKKRAEKRLKEIDHDRNEMMRLFIVADTPFTVGS